MKNFSKKKGFGGFLLVFAIFVAAIFLLSINTQTLQTNSLKEEIIQSKIVMTNYEIILKQSTVDCNWKKLSAEISNCIDNNANTALAKENTIQSFLTCSKTNLVTIIDSNKYSFELNCVNQNASPQKNLQISMQKKIIIQRP